MAASQERRDIGGIGRTLWEMFNNRRYAIDTYQREYKWQPKQVVEMLEDLSSKFLEDYEVGQERSEVAHYGHYFLGSIILSQKNGVGYIIDGQQRLTTLTLLLIYLNRRQHNLPEDDKVDIENLILTKKFGRRTFNLDVPERSPCLEKLCAGEPFEPTAKDLEAVRNMVARYKDTEQNFSSEITDQALPYFLDWLLNNVHVVEITAYSDEDAYTIFETMNDRGLSLAPLDMLKGYVIANISGEKDRERINGIWKHLNNELLELGKEEPSDAVKAWLRSQYADSIRDRKKGATPGDFDRQGTEFHRWVRDNEKRVGLAKSTDFVRFVDRELSFYVGQYHRLQQTSWESQKGLENVYYNAWLGFTLQYPLLLAPLTPDDKAETIARKIRVVATFLDILLARRLWNFRSIAYSTMQYAMFLVMRDIRRKPVDKLVTILRKKLDATEETFDSDEPLRMHQQNRSTMHWLLARITDWVGVQAGQASRFDEYMAEGRGRYEIEHIWSDHWDWHGDEFTNEADFAAYRNRIGGLLLLPKSFNASYGDLPYDEKRPHYLKQNLLAQSLHPGAYKKNPGFAQFIDHSGLAFTSHEHFEKKDLDSRQTLYTAIAEQIWNPDRLEEVLE